MEYNDFTALFVDARHDIAYVSDIETYEMIFMTKGAMELVGLHGEEEYRNKKCYEILQGLDAPCSFCTNKHLLEGQSPYIWKYYNPVVQKWLRLEDRLFHLDGRLCRGEWAIDISEEYQSISSMENELLREDVLLKSMRTLATEPDIHTAMNLFLQYIGDYYQADRTCIFEINYMCQSVSNTYEWCAEGIDSRKASFQNAPLEYVQEWVDSFSAGKTHNISTALEKEKETAMGEVLASRGVINLQIVPLHKDDTIVGFLGVDNAKAFADDTTLLRMSADLVTEEFQKRQLLLDLDSREFTDPLTGLQNRHKYIQTVKEYQQNPPKSLAVFFLDLNGLKELNEHKGHDYGDRFICRCAEALNVLKVNTFRIDGDEFILLLPGVDKKTAQRKEMSIRAALKTLEPYSVSVGASWAGGNVDVLALVAEADDRMYAEKQVYYRKVLSEGYQYRTGAASDVLQDIRAGNFVVYFQPQVELETGAIYGAEALVRKLDKDGKIIPPNQFVPLYETGGVISHMDFHVLELTCSLMKTWREELGKQPRISINFSRQTLMEPDVVRRIFGTCDKYGVSPEQFTIEVTESVGKLTQEQLYGLVQDLQEAGFSVSLDDFGTQYSNLSILSGIDFQMIKLDKSLIDKICSEEKSKKIIMNLIHLCKDIIATPSLAEGVETKEQASALREYSCDYAQGYYFSRPVASEAFTSLLAQEKVFQV